jgi:GTPase SAR1 family protein
MASYFKNALGLVLVYDITKHDSFENLNKWYALAMENCNEFVSILVVTVRLTVDWQQDRSR